MTLDKFRDAVENRHEYAREWKSATGGKVCGCLCGNVPEEIIYAAGVLPVRILAEHKSPTLAESHIPDNKCSFCRGCLEEGLSGRYDYIDGLAYTRSCVATGMSFSCWYMHLPLAWSHQMFTPFRPEKPLAKETFIRCLEELKLSLEEWRGAPISEEALAQSVDTYRTNRQLMRQVYELRKMRPPLISGSDAKRIVLASMLMDKEEHNDLLQQLLREKQELQGPNNEGVRVMVIGSGYDDVAFTELVESLGGDVVIDDHCLGLRYFWGNAVMDKDPMAAIASYYLEEKPACPSADCFGEKRIARNLQLAQEYDVEAVIYLAQMFCATHQWDEPDVISAFHKEGIPILRLETDVTIPIGPFRTRIEAMLEMAKGEIY